MIGFLLGDVFQNRVIRKGLREKGHIVGGRVTLLVLQAGWVLKIGIFEAKFGSQFIHLADKKLDIIFACD